jgi:hypothetical protein
MLYCLAFHLAAMLPSGMKVLTVDQALRPPISKPPFGACMGLLRLIDSDMTTVFAS